MAAMLGLETPPAIPRCAEDARPRSARAPAKREPEPAHVVDGFNEVDVAEGDEEEQGADGDSHQRDQLRDGAGHLPALVLVLIVDLVGLYGLYGLCGRARRDIIDVRNCFVVLEIVDRVDASARALLDGPSRLVILLRALLVSQAFRRCRRTEVRAAIPASGSWRSAGAARTKPPAGPWPSESAATAEAATTAETAATGSRTTKAPARSRRKASRAWRPRWTILARARFADRQRATLKWLCVEFADHFLRFVTVHEFDERESCDDRSRDRPAWQRGGLSDWREVGAEVRLTRTVGEVPDEQTDCQGLVKSPLSRRGFDSISKTHSKSQRSKGRSKAGQKRQVKGAGHRNKDGTSTARKDEAASSSRSPPQRGR